MSPVVLSGADERSQGRTYGTCLTTTYDSLADRGLGRRAVFGVAIKTRAPGAAQHAGPTGVGVTPVSSGKSFFTSPFGASAPPAAAPNLNPPVGPAQRLDGAQFTSVEQVFRFDVTKEWVYQNWSRKTTAPTDVGLVSVRVPLVMGTQLSALAGSLTYNFNAQGQVEHISFRGRTGDPSQLVQLLTRSYQFQPVNAPAGERLYQVADGDGVRSELRLQAEPIIRSNQPQQNVTVELEFARPGSQRFLPSRTPALQLPPAETPVASPEAAAEAGSSDMTTAVKSAASNYWNQVRYATPDERIPLQTKRWPQ